MSDNDESKSIEVFTSESTPASSQEASGDVEIDLETLAAEDDALWNSQHTSDEEEFDPENPRDLTTSTAKADAEDDVVDSGEEDDSFVAPDEEDSLCADHESCISAAKKVDEELLRTMRALSGKKERRAALVEVMCDHYRLQ